MFFWLMRMLLSRKFQFFFPYLQDVWFRFIIGHLCCNNTSFCLDSHYNFQHQKVLQEDISAKIITLNKNLIAKFIAENFNSCIDEGEFFSELKHAGIVPIHKKKDKSDKSINRPVSIPPNYSKVYEKLIYNQLYQYFENILFPSHCRFRK